MEEGGTDLLVGYICHDTREGVQERRGAREGGARGGYERGGYERERVQERRVRERECKRGGYERESAREEGTRGGGCKREGTREGGGNLYKSMNRLMQRTRMAVDSLIL